MSGVGEVSVFLPVGMIQTRKSEKRCGERDGESKEAQTKVDIAKYGGEYRLWEFTYLE